MEPREWDTAPTILVMSRPAMAYATGLENAGNTIARASTSLNQHTAPTSPHPTVHSAANTFLEFLMVSYPRLIAATKSNQTLGFPLQASVSGKTGGQLVNFKSTLL